MLGEVRFNLYPMRTLDGCLDLVLDTDSSCSNVDSGGTNPRGACSRAVAQKWDGKIEAGHGITIARSGAAHACVLSTLAGARLPI